MEADVVGHAVGGFLFGFLGSLHCAGMCGPIALALPVPQGTRAHFLVGRGLYNLGRSGTYALLGVVAGLLGKYLAAAGVQQMVSIVLGCSVILAVSFPTLRRYLPGRLPLIDQFTATISRAVAERLTVSSGGGLFVLGLVNGLLPCGFVYLALAAAATVGDTLGSVVFMAGFGVGTIPVMLSIALAGKSLQGGIRRRLAAALPILAVVLGVLLVMRGLNLGIPFVSPHVERDRAVEEIRCHEQ